jgi:hypothetical protein
MTTTVARPLGRENSAQMYSCQAKICAGLSRAYRKAKGTQLRMRSSAFTPPDAGCGRKRVPCLGLE